MSVNFHSPPYINTSSPAHLEESGNILEAKLKTVGLPVISVVGELQSPLHICGREYKLTYAILESYGRRTQREPTAKPDVCLPISMMLKESQI